MSEARRRITAALHTGSALWVTVGALGTAVLTVIGFRVIGDIAGATGFGQAVLLYGISLLVSSIVAGPVSQAIARFYFDAESPVARARLMSSGLAIVGCGVASVLLAMTAAALVGWVDRGVAILLAASLLLEMLRPLCSAWLQSECRFASLALAQWIDAGLRPVVAPIAFQFGMRGAELVLLSYVIAASCSVGVLVFRVARSARWSAPDRAEVRRIGRYGYPLVANALFGWMGNSGDRYLIAAALGPRTAGIYVAASALGGRLSLMLGSIFDTYFRPRLYAAAARRDRRALRAVCLLWARNLTLVGGAMLGALAIGLPLIQRVLLGPEFRDGSGPVIMISFVAYWVIALGFIPLRINYALERTGLVALIEIAGMATMAVAVYLLGRGFGLSGAALGLAFSGLTRLLLAIALARVSLRDAERESKVASAALDSLPATNSVIRS